MAAPAYQGILFPDRAESLDQFARYKVFLDHWAPLAAELQDLYEGLALRRESRALAVYGAQGTGKTLFATKLVGDFQHSKDALTAGNLAPDEANLWHRVTGGRALSKELIEKATHSADMLLIENEKDWVENTAKWLAARKDRHCILVGDNAERAYFRQGLVALSDAEFLQLGDTNEAMKMAAQSLVTHCRTDLRGSLLLLLTNDDIFLLGLHDAVQSQHSELIRVEQLPLPKGSDKEAVVRVNTNRLNPISYWYCLDKAGPDHKRIVRDAITGASSFPATFQAVNQAIRTAPAARFGRRARKNQISLVVLSDEPGNAFLGLPELGDLERTEFQHLWAGAKLYNEAWAGGAVADDRERRLLESEWNLRLVVLGRPFVASLVYGDDTHRLACARMLENLKAVLGPGTHQTTRAQYEAAFQALIDSWPDTSTLNLTAFWDKGQARSADYEAILRDLLPGYNCTAKGMLNYRPDYIVEPFAPCAVTAAISGEIEAIHLAIQRRAHVFEFTAQRTPTEATIRSYLADKLPNYVQITQEQ